MEKFNGLGMNLGNLSRISHAQSRSICGENPTGGKGAGAMAEPDPHKHARELGRGWKCNAWRPVEPGLLGWTGISFCGSTTLRLFRCAVG